MATSSPRSSVFTFESTVHSSHVLLCLDEQRRRDTLCDVTVLVEGQSFRAHRSVLASCSEYFTHRISSLTQHGAVIALSGEVTAAGFEPLLKFAYTSKLLFRKDDVLEIRNAASILGFRDLDEACFDFLLPKFFSSTQGSAPFPRKTCCKKKCKRQLSKEDHGTNPEDVLLDEKEVKPVADSPFQQEVAWLCNKSVNSKIESQNGTSTVSPVAEGTQVMQCPKYRKFQLACGKETCFTQKSLNSQGTAIRDDCSTGCSPCSSSANNKNEAEVDFPGSSALNSTRQSKGAAFDPLKTEIHEKKTEAVVGIGEVDIVKKERNEKQGKWSEKVIDMNKLEGNGFSDKSSIKALSSGPRAGVGERSSGLTLHHCQLRPFGDSYAITGSLGHKRIALDITEDKKTMDSGVLASIYQKEQLEAGQKGADAEKDSGWRESGEGGQPGITETVALSVNNARERNTVEREVAEHLAERLGSNVGSSQLNFQDPDAGSPSDTASRRAQSTSLEWLQNNLSSSSTSCPFFQDLDQSKCSWKGAELSECEGASQSGVSSLNSGEDGDSDAETEGDSESCTRERAKQVQLQFSVDWIVDLSRNDFQQLLKQQVFTREQLDFVHDMRRRSKNRLAAQRCRKRKLDCIYDLQCEINKLRTEREKLITEKSELSRLKLKTCHSVSALCQKVCSEAKLRPEQLQVFAKYTSPDCPLSSFFPHIDTLLSQPGFLPQPQVSLSACSLGLDLAYKEALSGSSRDAVTGDDQHSL